MNEQLTAESSELWFKVSEVAWIIGLSNGGIHNAMARGELVSVKVPGKPTMIPKSSIRAYFNDDAILEGKIEAVLELRDN